MGHASDARSADTFRMGAADADWSLRSGKQSRSLETAIALVELNVGSRKLEMSSAHGRCYGAWKVKPVAIEHVLESATAGVVYATYKSVLTDI